MDSPSSRWNLAISLRPDGGGGREGGREGGNERRREGVGEEKRRTEGGREVESVYIDSVCLPTWDR